MLGVLKKSRIRETKHLSTDADSSTNTTLGWTKNTQKPEFIEKVKKSSQMEKLKNVQKYAKISDTPFDQRSLIHREAWFSPCFVRQNQPKNLLKKCLAILDQFPTKKFKHETTSFHYFSPKDSESLKILDIPLWEVGAKRHFNGTSKMNRWTDRRTHGHADGNCDLQKASAQRADALKIYVTCDT